MVLHVGQLPMLVFKKQEFKKCAIVSGFRRSVTITLIGCTYCSYTYVYILIVQLLLIFRNTVVPVLSTGTKIIPVSALFIPVLVLELELDLEQ